jgi:hypothetical protein
MFSKFTLILKGYTFSYYEAYWFTKAWSPEGRDSDIDIVDKSEFGSSRFGELRPKVSFSVRTSASSVLILSP